LTERGRVGEMEAWTGASEDLLREEYIEQSTGTHVHAKCRNAATYVSNYKSV
jgi:hypothetical protein